MDDLEQAYINNTPIYSKNTKSLFRGKMGYSQCTSIMKIVDGTVVHYYLSFVVAYNATNSDNIYNHLIDLRGVTGEGWRDATSRASCLFTKTAVPVGTSIPFTGGFVIMDLSTWRKQGFDYKPARLLSASKIRLQRSCCVTRLA